MTRPWFFFFLSTFVWDHRKSVSTAKKNVSVNISEDAKFERYLLKSTQKPLYKTSQLCTAISPLAFNLSLLNLGSFLILRRSFQRCQWIFADWLFQNLKKNRGRMYSKINTVAAFSFLSTSPLSGGIFQKNQLRHPLDSVIYPSEQLGPAVIRVLFLYKNSFLKWVYKSIFLFKRLESWCFKCCPP